MKKMRAKSKRIIKKKRSCGSRLNDQSFVAALHLPVIKIKIDNKMVLRKMTEIAVHFHVHLAARPLRKFSGAE